MGPITMLLRLYPETVFRVHPQTPTLGTSGFKAFSPVPKCFLRDFLLSLIKSVLLFSPLSSVTLLVFLEARQGAIHSQKHLLTHFSSDAMLVYWLAHSKAGG